jgi:pilus assembly protein CpaC
MMRSMLIRTATLAAVIGAIGIPAADRTLAADRAPAAEPSRSIRIVGDDKTSQFLPLGVGKSVVIDLPRDVKDVLVADPTIANAVMRSLRRAYIIGVKGGQTNIFFFDANGQQIGGLNIVVAREVNRIQQALKQALPDRDIHVESLGDGFLLSGVVASPMEAQLAFDIATRVAESGGGGVLGGILGGAGIAPGGSVSIERASGPGGGGTTASASSGKVVSYITIAAPDQVSIHVTFAEVDRQVIKQVGINLTGSASMGSAVLNFNTNNPFSANGGPLSSTAFAGTFKSVTATLQAMERAGVTRVLAEPTLTAISGEKASFLAGGKFPYPSITSCTTSPCPPLVAFQDFGLMLNFIPVVLSEGRISLKISMESSELAPENSVTVAGTTVPGLTVRRADTTVEIPSGGSLALAGMIQEETKHQINGIPQLMQIPILGTLFKSRDYLNGQTELMVIATPYIVRAVARNKLSLPDDGYADATDPSAVLLARMNRIYGVRPSTQPDRTYHGNVGFILD